MLNGFLGFVTPLGFSAAYRRCCDSEAPDLMVLGLFVFGTNRLSGFGTLSLQSPLASFPPSASVGGGGGGGGVGGCSGETLVAGS